MSQQGKELSFKLFGRFSVMYGGSELKLDKSGATRVMQLLAMLIYHREGVSRQELLQSLYGEKELADRNNNLRVTAFKLRKMLIQAGLPEDNYISVHGAMYQWTSTVPTVCDVWEFQECVTQADRARLSGDKELELLLRKKACMLYTGEFLQSISGADWVIMEAVAFKRKFNDCLERLLYLLEERADYQDIVDFCAVAENIYPYENWWLQRVDALIEMTRYDEALAVYEKFTKRYFEELGLSPTEEMLSRYQRICEMNQHRYSTVEEIYWEMVEKPASPGGNYVTPPQFVDRFRYLQRLSERSGESNYLVVTTMSKKSGRPEDDNGFGDWADEIMRDVLRQSLRREDTFTKYNSSQYLMLLVGIDLESVRIVTRRIDQRLTKAAGNWKLVCQYRALPLRQQDTASLGIGWDMVENETGGASS